MSPRQLDAFVLMILVAVSTILTLTYAVSVLTTAVLLFGLPGIYLLLRSHKHVVRDMAGALLLGLVFGCMVDYFGGLNAAWTYHGEWFVFPGPIVGHVRVDIMLWAYGWALWIILFWEHFFDGAAPDRLSKRFLPMLTISLTGLAALLALPYSAAALTIPYAYLIWGVLSFVPLFLALWWYPRFSRRLMLAGTLLAVPNIVFEAVALKWGYWSFSGQYLLSGRSLPLEEILFWTFGSSFIVLANFLLFVRAEE